jgi:aldehyde dehydrogenase (NAD+)
MVSAQTEVNGTVLPADGDAQGPGWGAYPGPIGSSGAFGGFKQSGIGRYVRRGNSRMSLRMPSGIS